MKIKRKIVLGAVLALALAPWAKAGEMTAFQLIKEGGRYVGDQSKDKVVQVRSEKSVASLTPNIWYVVYYDPDAPLKNVEVKFGAGQEMKVTRPVRPFEVPTHEDKVLDRTKLTVDSDRALEIAKSQELLKNLTLRASQMWLQRGEGGAVWKIKLWAAKLKNPSHDADIGVIIISATDGSMVKLDLHPNSVD